MDRLSIADPMAVTASTTNLAGLPRRLVQDGLISEEKLLEAAEWHEPEKDAVFLPRLGDQPFLR